MKSSTPSAANARSVTLDHAQTSMEFLTSGTLTAASASASQKLAQLDRSGPSTPVLARLPHDDVFTTTGATRLHKLQPLVTSMADCFV